MKYLLHKFRSPANSRAYVDNWDAVFGDRDGVSEGLPVPTAAENSNDSCARRNDDEVDLSIASIDGVNTPSTPPRSPLDRNMDEFLEDPFEDS